MQILHAGPSQTDLAMPRCSNYLCFNRKTKGKRAMFDIKDTQPMIIDTLQIEAEARRLRAQVIAQGFAALTRKIAALFAAHPAPKPQS
jgi:hypothetical protein